MNAPVLPATQTLRERLPDAHPRIAVVLGSGWGGVTALIDDPVRVPYCELTGFPPTGVAGHAGELWVGKIGHNEVAVMSGRKHAYEDGDAGAMRAPLQALRDFGCDVLVLTNASGSLVDAMPPGSLMVIGDHINTTNRSPLIGEHGTARFVDMSDAYDAKLRATAHGVAKRTGVSLHEGVYVWNMGPQFETPAEIRMFRQLGAHAVGMSTVPETILARRAGMRVLGLSLVTNMGAGLSAEVLSHAHTLSQAQVAGAAASRFLADVIKEITP